jgi:glycerophosphoryl diester phosphodiesterase
MALQSSCLRALVRLSRFTGTAILVCLAASLAMSSPVHSLDLQGHRGARGLLPENTLPAFARALEIGVTTLELDCAITGDGVVVISHDALLNPDITRGPDGRWLDQAGPAIASLTYQALRGYDVGRIRPGSQYAARFPRQRPVDGTRIPRLSELFELVKKSGNTSVRFNIETKISPEHPDRSVSPEAFVDALVLLLVNEKLTARSAIQSFDWRILQLVQQKAPEIQTVYLSAQQSWLDNIRASAGSSPWTAGLHVSAFGGSLPRMVNAAGGTVWSPYYGEVTRESVREAHGLGLKVVVWTVNQETDMRRMVALGVDGIISDYPDLLRRVAGEMKLPLPLAAASRP